MARIRTLKPDLWQDEALGTVSVEAQCLFVGLITQADDEGRLRASTARLRAQLWPYKPEIDTARVDQWLAELAGQGLVVRYEVGGKAFVALPSWGRHQRIYKPTMSELPAPPEGADPSGAPDADPSGASAPVDEQSPTVGKSQQQSSTPQQGREGKGEENTSTASGALAMVARRLFAYWQERCDHPQAKFTLDRRRKVEARLREGYTEDQIRQAIDGAAVGAFVNDTGKRFDDLELICRVGSKLESFIDRARPTTSNGQTSRQIGQTLRRQREQGPPEPEPAA